MVPVTTEQLDGYDAYSLWLRGTPSHYMKGYDLSINLSDWAILDEPIPSRIRGLTPEVQTLADQAAEDRRTRRAPLDAEDVLAVMGRYLASRKLKVTYRPKHTDNGSYLVWQVQERQSRPLTPEHVAKLRAAAAKRQAQGAQAAKQPAKVATR